MTFKIQHHTEQEANILKKSKKVKDSRRELGVHLQLIVPVIFLFVERFVVFWQLASSEHPYFFPIQGNDSCLRSAGDLAACSTFSWHA